MLEILNTILKMAKYLKMINSLFHLECCNGSNEVLFLEIILNFIGTIQDGKDRESGKRMEWRVKMSSALNRNALQKKHPISLFTAASFMRYLLPFSGMHDLDICW